MMKKIIAASSVVAMALTAFPALAVDNVTITNENKAEVENLVLTSSATGLNFSNGGTGGAAGAGGHVSMSDDGNLGGNGGDAGDGGMGGEITTGEAGSLTAIENHVGLNKVVLGCECDDVDDVEVKNKNEAGVGNGVATLSDSGLNLADGGTGGAGKAGGNVEDSKDDNAGGDGGAGGAGGAGGSITTGMSTSVTSVLNRVGKNVVRLK